MGMKQFISRRRVLAAALPMLTMPFSLTANAISPKKVVPSPIEELIPRLTLLISAGRVTRQLFITQELERKLVEGKPIDPAELRLLDLKEFDGVGPVTTFLAVTHTRPLWVRRDALGMPAYSGTVYFYGFDPRQTDEALALRRLVGQECIFLIDHLFATYANGMPSFPSPLYVKVNDGHWRESLPLPLSELHRVNRIAKKAGFLKPTPIISTPSKG